ncbi:hypothetical protein SAMN04487996_124106 [Dyadobacter soli]|uniref:Uncharacterized protein n=1 Tax=Dyadobacter soli TaxID=659014 RepID=A0A1G7XT81_9BACT|nr:hypothetical protein [Dyadobacter soli]SDG87415.1 hypothetical protein SAMN04487996_124106 [Dyadobacter soli]
MKTPVESFEERKKRVLADPRVQAILKEKMEATREFVESGGLERLRALKR